jgi:SAM-dependent methyltransferase
VLRQIKALGRYPIRTFDEFRNVAQLYQYSRVILTALELDLFSAIGSRSWKVAALSRRLKADARGLDILCRNLAALGLLIKRGSSYSNTLLGRTDLNRHSPTYRAEYLALIMRHWDDFGQLTRSVRSGRPLDADQPDDPAWRRSFTWAMHHRSREQADRMACALDLGKAESLLDLGGGPGTYALAFLAKNHALRATVADRPAALQVARKIAARQPAKARLSFAPVDFMTDPLPGRYDVVWLSNIIHIYSPAQNLALFRKIRKVLNAGGRLFIQDSFLTDPAGLYPIDTTAFAVTMLLFTDSGNTYAVRDVMGWLRRAGYGRVRFVVRNGAREYGENGLIEGAQP